jgi:hypothetical protein
MFGKKDKQKEKIDNLWVILIVFSLFCICCFSAMGMASQSSLGTFQQNKEVNLIQNCENSTYANITRVIYPNSTTAINIQTKMTSNGDDYNYSFSSTDALGTYVVYGSCDENGDKTNWVYDFIISKTGESNGGDILNIFIYSLFIASTIGLFYTLILGLIKLTISDTSIYDVLISWMFLLLIIIINFISNYQVNNLVSELSSKFIMVGAFTNGFLPLLSLIITIAVKSMKKGKTLSVQEFTGGKYG